MNRRNLFLSALVLAASNQVAIATPSYSIKDLTPAGYTNSTAYDINASGDVVGVAESFASGSSVRAYFFYDHSEGTSTVFGLSSASPRNALITGTRFRLAAINDDGKIAGTTLFSGGASQKRGFLYSGGGSGSFTDLGVFPPGSAIRPASDALDLNNSGLATGTASTGADIPGSDYLDIYTGTTSPITDIDGDTTVLTGGDLGRAINNAGRIAGSNQDNKAALFSGAAETAFLSGTSLASSVSWATDLNEVGQVTGGTISNASYVYDTSDASLRILPNLAPTAGRVQAKAINESGDVVGWGDRGAGLSDQARGFVHLFADSASYLLEDHTDLSDTTSGLGDWERLRTAWGINDSGWIVGVGDRRPVSGATFPNSRAYLLIPTPIPEPSALVLLALAGISCLWHRCRSVPLG